MTTAGLILLAIWLILTGIKPFARFGLPGGDQTLALLALLAGVLLLLGVVLR